MPKILLVNRDPFIGALLDALLAHEGYTVAREGRAQVAIDIIKEQGIDLIVLDTHSGEKDGFGLARRLRQEKYDIPIVFLADREDVANRGTALGLGNGFVVKPFEPRELLSKVQEILHRRKG